MAHDFYADQYDVVDGKRMLWAEATPDKKYEVVALMDSDGNETEDEDEAIAGVVKFTEECFVVFTF